ncbi:hypothetical protein OG594_23940 [Streptomyces sp. NBC_01214]|uniref:hypothetical protein n=1 Tax=Streptomyces sp. NBC_01214 TaxID=2903777 RepID=UPI00224EE14C|nr:hypothetical protein [Streptomyces sp. NBC_01214]MCX4804634.1 hypothetical protein [Streptomyces sp. NBC_01214]
MGKLRYVVEQTFALLHQFKRLAVRWERRVGSSSPTLWAQDHLRSRGEHPGGTTGSKA